MRLLAICVLLTIALAAAASSYPLAHTAGVIRVFGDASNWMSACFVVGDGSWIVTSYEAVVEKAGPEVERIVRHPLFISAYNGQACQSELKAYDADLGVALLKLPVSGLPAAPLAQFDVFSKAAYGTMGQLMSGDEVGNAWPTEIYGITREKKGDSYVLTVGQWNAAKAFVTDVDDYKWLFLSQVEPARTVPNGAIVARGDSAVGMYLNRMLITGGTRDIVFGRCALSTEIARYLGERGLTTASLYTPPQPTTKRPQQADAAFQLQVQIYSLVGSGRTELALEPAEALAKLRPDDPQVHIMKGLALTSGGKFDEAMRSYDEAAKLDPRLPSLRMNRALALIGLEKRAEAEEELKQAVADSPGDSRPVSALASFYLGDEKTLDSALTWANKTVTMDSGSPAAKLLVAQVLKRQKKYQEAANTIGEALKMAPNWGDAWFALGATYEEAGDKALAEKAYATLAEKQPNNPDSLLTYASFLVDAGKNDAALDVLKKIRELKPPQPLLDAVQKLDDRIAGKEPAPEAPAAGDGA